MYHEWQKIKAIIMRNNEASNEVPYTKYQTRSENKNGMTWGW